MVPHAKPTPPESPRERGAVLLLLAVVLVLVGALAAAFVSITRVQARAIDDTIQIGLASYVGEGAIDLARGQLWQGYQQSGSGNLDSFRDFLASSPYGALPAGGSLEMASFLPDLGARVRSLRVERLASVSGREDLEFRAIVETSGGDVEVTQRYRTEGTPFSGLEFVMLTNDVNCIFCHATFDSVRKYDGVSYPGVKIAALESVRARGGGGSTVAGSFYVRGTFADKSGRALDDPSNVITTFAKDARGFIEVDEDGEREETDLIEGVDFFPDYPTEVADQENGRVPGQFPPAFPDEDQDGSVNDAEFGVVAAASTGHLTGGIIHEVPRGGSYAGLGLPGAGSTGTIDGTSGGHTILVGTAADPIRIDGQVAVDGDLVIQGVVQGTGTIWARGNVYVVGDLEYADGIDAEGRRTYGVAADGTTNALGLAAGGNVLIGDYLTKAESTPAEGGKMSFTQVEMAIFNRREFARTQPTVPDDSGNPVPNPLHEPGYTPRFYVGAADEDVAVYLGAEWDGTTQGWKPGKGGKSYWDPELNTWGGGEKPGSFRDTLVVPRAELPAGWQTIPAAPAEPWLAVDQLRSFWDDASDRHDDGPLQLDAMLYTNNAIFAMASGSSAYRGQMTVNGGLVGRDMGVLVAKGLEVNYDDRIPRFFGVTDHQSIRLVHTGTHVRIIPPTP